MLARKTALCLLLTALFLLGVFPGSAQAAGNGFRDNSDYLQNYEPTEDRLQVYCASFGEQLPAAESFRARLASTDVPVLSVASAQDAPVTYYCVIDVSGSVTSVQLGVAREMLKTICDLLQDGDQMVIARVGNSIEVSDYLTDPDQIRAAIEQIHTTAEDTNLYRAVADGLHELSISSAANSRKCMLIFSDGDDESDSSSGKTLQEAERMIAETRIPVYTVIPASQKRDAGKILASFSRSSVGGQAYFLAQNGMSSSEVGRAFVEAVRSDAVLTLDLGAFNPDREELLLSVEYTDAGGNHLGDTMTVYRGNLILSEAPAAKPANSPVTPDPTQEPEAEQESAPKKGIPVWLIAVIAALVVLGAAAAFLVRRKKRSADAAVVEQPEHEGESFTGFAPEWNAGAEEQPEALAEPVRRKLRFTVVGVDALFIEIELEEGRTVTLGRDKRADIVFNPNDPKLSGVHCRVLLNGSLLRVWDAGSTNGTAVNGVPLQANYLDMAEGDILTVGAYRYRLHFAE